MEQYLLIAGRTIFLYFLILLIFRLMGKREIGELSILDLVVFIMIGEMAVVAIEDTKDPIMHSLIPMVLLMVIQITLAYLSLKSQRFREVIDGKPTVIINKGKIDEGAMKQQRYNFNDLMTQLREKDVKSVADVEFAILEPSGKLSVLEKNNSSANNSNDSNNPKMDVSLILDGVIQERNLERMGKTNLWLRQQLRELGHKDIKEISFCSYNNGAFFIDKKDEK